MTGNLTSIPQPPNTGPHQRPLAIQPIQFQTITAFHMSTMGNFTAGAKKYRVWRVCSHSASDLSRGDTPVLEPLVS